MRTFIILLFLSSSCYTQSFVKFDGAAGDVWHIAGSTFLVLGTQKAFDWGWKKAAVFTFTAGFMWELQDELFKTDPKGFDGNDILRNIIGIAISYPLKCNIGIKKNRITFSYRF